MLLFLITCCFSFIFFHKSFSLKKPLPYWTGEMRLISPYFWKDLTISPLTNSPFFASKSSPKKKGFSSEVSNVEITSEMSLLDLPDLALDCILEKLPPEGLCKMATVCKSLNDRCTSDQLWEKHLNRKWGKIVGAAAYREWKYYIASIKGSVFFNQGERNGLIGYFSRLWPFALIRSSLSDINKKRNYAPVDSIMGWYLALECGEFRFPAQVYNRENAHVGFLLSCYDAELTYDQHTDTFQARYPPHGRRVSAMENGLTWDRLRPSPIDTSPHDLHVSDCLNQLKPGNHIEIQWRRNKEFPYGWWYGVVGHLETCDRNTNYCRCHESDTLVLEFNQYVRGSRWRRTIINRKDHREEGNEEQGFYGGIRKLCGDEEISRWEKLWPAEVLE